MRKTIKIDYNETEYAIKQFGFFKANKVIKKYLTPILPKLAELTKDADKEDREGMDMIPVLVSAVEDYPEELVESMFKDMFDEITINDKKLDVDEHCAGDYGLVIFLLAEVIHLNYNSFFDAGNGFKKSKLAQLFQKETQENSE